jgi:VCBS repeat-containing protein
MTTVTVSNSAGLIAALGHSQGGDTILLASGTYSSVSITNFHSNGVINIASANAATPAVISQLAINNSSGLKFSGVTLANSTYSNPSSSSASTPFQVFNSSNITFSGISVHGSLDGNADDDINGMLVQYSKNITIENSTFQQLRNAILESNNSDVNITNNNIHDIRTDGIDNSGTSNIIISGNNFSNFFPVGDAATGDHPDAIQFWTSGTTSSASNITIVDNTYVRGSGLAAQGIFVTDQVGLPYENVVISGNTIIGGQPNAIDLQNGINVNVSSNTVESYADISSSIKILYATGVTASNNMASSFGYTGVSFSGNLNNQIVGTVSAVSSLAAVVAAGPASISAVAESVNVAEFQTVVGNALSADAGAALYIADVGVGGNKQTTLPTAGASFTGTYGTLTVQQNGTFSYVETKQSLMVGQVYDDHFVLTVASASGGLKLTSLDVLVTGSPTGNGTTETIVGGALPETISTFGASSILWSGSGDDIFAFSNLSQGAPSASTQIKNFKAGDIIDLSAVDPNFHLVSRLDGHANELVVSQLGGNTWEIYGDTTGSGVANFEIHLTGVTTPLTASSFHL